MHTIRKNVKFSTKKVLLIFCVTAPQSYKMPPLKKVKAQGVNREAFCSIEEAVTQKINRTFCVGNLTCFNLLHNYFFRNYIISGDKREKQIFKGLKFVYKIKFLFN